MVEVNLVRSRADALTKAPLGCAFLDTASWAGLPAAEIAEPAMAMYLLSRAVSDVRIWSQNYASEVAALLAAGPELRTLAESVLALPATDWWFGPMLREQQLWHVSGDHTEFAASRQSFVPDREPTLWERYAQKPAWGLRTSTDVKRTALSSLLVGESERAGDLGPIRVLFRAILAHSLAVSASVHGGRARGVAAPLPHLSRRL